MIQIILFVLTFGSTYMVGELTLQHSGLVYAGPLMLILLCHEGGHYVMCRLYGVKATPPNFIPAPFPPFGTFGAVILMKQNLPSRRAIFDIGMAGPLSGFVVAVPFILGGLELSDVAAPGEAEGAWMLGDPLLFKMVISLRYGDLAGREIMLHPTAYAGWIGMLITALNLLPAGQLDGGHITYAVLGKYSRLLFWPLIAGLVALTILMDSPAYIVFIGLLLFIGSKHPRPADDRPLDVKRKLFALVALAILVLCFIPVPIRMSVPGGGS